jgi:regulator of replication initiation timing
MILNYKILKHTRKGLLETPDTQILELDSEIMLSFLLPDAGEYLAVFVGADGREKPVRVKEGMARLPPEMRKPQLIAVSVWALKDGKPSGRWICQAFRIIDLAETGKRVFQVVEEYPELPEIVKGLLHTVEEIKAENSRLAAENDSLRAQLAEKQESIRAAISQDVAGLVAYKALNTAELKKLADAINAINEEIKNIKSEFSL